jgi:hypothetical protein
MGSIQIEMRCKRNPNPKDDGVLPQRHVGSVVLDLHDKFRELAPRHRRPAASDLPKCAAVDVLASKAHRHTCRRRIQPRRSLGRGPEARRSQP